MLSTVWFSPTVQQSDSGQAWYRCDAIGVESEGRLATLKGSLKGVLDSDAGLATYGICGTAEPGAPGFERVICGSKHSWEAIDAVDVPGAAYPASAPASVEAQVQGPGPQPRRRRAQLRVGLRAAHQGSSGRTGRRYALCWAPELTAQKPSRRSWRGSRCQSLAILTRRSR